MSEQDKDNRLLEFAASIRDEEGEFLYSEGELETLRSAASKPQIEDR